MIAKGRGSGIEMRRRDAIAYRLTAGKIVRLEYFNDQAEALKAVGFA
jgi:ketosteroid isomerase-like protein